MPFVRSDGTWANVRDVTLLPAQTLVVATVQGTGVEVGGRRSVSMTIVTGTVSGGSPTLTLHVQTSFDNGVTDAYHDVVPIAQQAAAITTAATNHYSVGGLDRWVRVSAVVTGTGQFAASSVVGELGAE